MDRDQEWEWLRQELAEMRQSLSRMDRTLAEQHISLRIHMRRTDALEKRVDGMWMRVLAVVGGLVGIASGVAKLFGLA